MRRSASGGPLNAPWGMAIAPKSFGPLGGDLLIASSGNGQIDAYHWTGKKYIHDGAMQAPGGKPLKIPGCTASRSATAATPARRAASTSPPAPKSGAHGRLGFLKPA